MIKEKIRNPFKTIDFYFRKTATMFANPTYQSQWYNLQGGYYPEDNSTPYADKIEKKIATSRFFTSLYEGILDKIVQINAKGIQLAIYTFSFIYVIAALRKKEITKHALLLILIFLGGYAFHLMWEAKARYIIVYNLALFPLAFVMMEEILEKLVKKR